VTILDTGRRLGVRVPPDVKIVAIQIEDARTFSETCTTPVAATGVPASRLAIELALPVRGGQDRRE